MRSSIQAGRQVHSANRKLTTDDGLMCPVQFKCAKPPPMATTRRSARFTPAALIGYGLVSTAYVLSMTVLAFKFGPNLPLTLFATVGFICHLRNIANHAGL